MQEENRKEILTRDILKKDAKSILIYNIFMHLLYCLFFLLILLIIYWAFFLSDISRQTLNTFFSIIAVLGCVPFGLVVIRCIKMLLLLKKDCFNIVTDKVCNKKANAFLTRKNNPPSSKPILSFGISTTNFSLHFEKHKKYSVAFGEHYNFSEVNKMHYLQQAWSTEIGDEFYLFVIDKKIIEIYNTKFFELQE